MGSYNGYTNWETWNLILWISNEREPYDKVQVFVRDNIHVLTPPLVKAFVRQRVYPKGTPDMATRNEMQKVNWEEITTNLKEWND